MRYWTGALPLALVVALHAAPAHAEVGVTFGLSATLWTADTSPRWTLATMPVGNDKIQHFVAGLAIAWMLSAAGYDPRAALVGATAAGALKEARDAGMLPGLGHGNAEVADFAWTFAGGMAYLSLQQMLTRPAAPRSLHNN